MNKIIFGTPSLNKKDKAHLLKAFESSWISQGPFNKKFENLFKKIHQSKFSLTVVNGTKAVMLALMSLNLKRGDEILVPEYCYISPINICKILGLKIKLVKINKDNLQIEFKDLEKKISKRSKCLLLIHNYGNTSDINKIVKLTKKHNVKILEDFSEALFTKYKNKYVGTFGDISVVSFHATKTITTGEVGVS